MDPMENEETSGHRLFLFFLVLTVLVTIALLGLGNVVTRTGSGMGCGEDWPKCNGRWIPDFTNIHVVLEYSHRIFAAFVGFLVLFLTVGAWRIDNRRFKSSLRTVSLSMLFLLVFQVILGAVTVNLRLPPEIVISHNGVSILFFCALVFLMWRVLQMHWSVTGSGKTTESIVDLTSLYGPIMTGTLLIFLQILLGAYVRHSGAAAGCPDVPLCHGQLLPPPMKPAVVHFAHRVLGLIAGGYVFYLTWRVGKSDAQRRHFVLAIAASSLVILQVIIGGITAVSAASTDTVDLVFWSTIHLVNASLIIGCLVPLLAASMPIPTSGSTT